VPLRIAVFASGAGSNLEALLRHLGPPAAAASAAGTIALVISNRPAAGALEIAARHDVPRSVLVDGDDAAALFSVLSRYEIDLLALAGYLKRIPTNVTDAFRGRALNVHPALLPAFGGSGMYGARIHRAVIDAGVRVTGVTVHFIDAIYDHGPIIAQWPVPVHNDDSPSVLAERVLRVEHALYPRVVEAVAAGRVSLDERGRVRGEIIDPMAKSFSLSREDVGACVGVVANRLGPS
jgi:phosphoribosylglycinamide formyltransferase 1